MFVLPRLSIRYNNDYLCPVFSLYYHVKFNWFGAERLSTTKPTMRRGESMQPPQDSGSSLQDSVVGGNLHTGNVIHNHYHITQNPSSPQQPQQVQQPVAQQPQQVQQPVVQQPGYAPGIQGIQSSGTNDDELLIAYLIWFFLGLFGGHRFYFGHFGLGVLYFLTGGFFIIGWIVDLFLIGDLVRDSKRKQMMQQTGQMHYR